MGSFKARQDVGSLCQHYFKSEKREPMLMLSLLRHEWPEVVGETLAAKTRPLRLAKRVLWIAATDACWAYELQFFKSDLLHSVKNHLGGDAVQDIRFQAVPQGESMDSSEPAHPPPATHQPALSPPLEGAAETDPGNAVPSEALSLAARTIQDPTLRASFLRTFGRPHGKIKS